MRLNLLFLLWAAPMMASAQPIFNVLDFGAKPDGVTMSTLFIQAAIDRAAVEGQGGVVLLPPGRFMSGSLHLKSKVEIRLAAGATLLGSTQRFDYQKINWHALLLADGQEDIAVTGKGIIDGQGAALAADVYRLVKAGKIIDPYWSHDRPHERERPQLIEFARCHRVRVAGITLKNSACWVQTYDRCDGLLLDSLTVDSRAYWNNDGIDLVDCRNAVIRNCDINSADDGICLKSTWPPAFCENILIENCRIRSSASAFKIGTSSHGGFRHIRVRHLEIEDTYRSAIALETVDGAFLEDIDIQDIRALNTGNAIFIRLGHRFQKRLPGLLRGVRIRDLYAEIPAGRPDAGYAFEGPAVTAPHNLMPSSITGLPGHPVQDVLLENVEIVFAGGGRAGIAEVSLDSLERVPERPADYPEFSMFGELPAWGFYVRHAEGLRFRKVRLRCVDGDFRPAVVLDDVRGMSLKKMKIDKKSAAPVLVQHNCEKVKVKRLQVN